MLFNEGLKIHNFIIFEEELLGHLWFPFNFLPE